MSEFMDEDQRAENRDGQNDQPGPEGLGCSVILIQFIILEGVRSWIIPERIGSILGRGTQLFQAEAVKGSNAQTLSAVAAKTGIDGDLLLIRTGLADELCVIPLIPRIKIAVYS